ncbi:MAG: hypothetical protein LBH25_05685 [Fibromonadaceae bacterium]|jgi:hypothetical protein|nr:hypothetical protein [Fibromonadaceae bacterium]
MAGIYKNKRFSKECLPVWQWASLITPDFFTDIPPGWKMPEEAAEEEAAPKNEPKKEKQLYYYARAKTQLCIDGELSFCETLAVVYARLQEGLGEKIFLRGNVFLAKISKAVFEQNGSLFAEACMKHKDEKYFNECAEELDKMDFVIEKDKKIDKNSWLGLYGVVQLLTSEYLAAKCELPKISASECKENSESAETLDIIVTPQSAGEADLKEAALAPLELEKDGLYDSSDHMVAGELFHEFLCENFPFKDDKSKLAGFIGVIYGKDVCEDLDQFCNDAANNVFPRPDIKIDALEEEDSLGDHEGDAIYINQRLVLDALRSPDACYILFLTMLIEYGHFLGHALHEKTGNAVKNPEFAGKTFAYWFMKCSDADLFNTDFDFADFISHANLVCLDDRGEGQKLIAKVSGLIREQREKVFHTLGTKNIWEGED